MPPWEENLAWPAAAPQKAKLGMLGYQQEQEEGKGQLGEVECRTVRAAECSVGGQKGRDGVGT